MLMLMPFTLQSQKMLVISDQWIYKCVIVKMINTVVIEKYSTQRPASKMIGHLITYIIIVISQLIISIFHSFSFIIGTIVYYPQTKRKALSCSFKVAPNLLYLNLYTFSLSVSIVKIDRK